MTDINQQAIDKLLTKAKTIGTGVKVVNKEEIYQANADIFIPCAMGGIINSETIEQLRVKAVVGSANNQLLEVNHGQSLKEKGILFVDPGLPEELLPEKWLGSHAASLFGDYYKELAEPASRFFESVFQEGNG